jgi:GTP-binding protein EngB required for normal cell division
MVSRKGRDAVVQHALLPSDSPLEKTPHNARVISVALMAAVVALLGYSGIGKSSIVHELHKVVVLRREIFTSGKCDQRKRLPWRRPCRALCTKS